MKYLQTVAEQSVADSSSDPWMQLKADSTLHILQSLLEKVLSILAKSAPIECVFSQSCLIMRQNRARLGKKLLCQLDFMKCNNDL